MTDKFRIEGGRRDRDAGLGALAIGILIVAAMLALWGGIAYILFHFIGKYW